VSADDFLGQAHLPLSAINPTPGIHQNAVLPLFRVVRGGQRIQEGEIAVTVWFAPPMAGSQPGCMRMPLANPKKVPTVIHCNGGALYEEPLMACLIINVDMLVPADGTSDAQTPRSGGGGTSDGNANSSPATFKKRFAKRFGLTTSPKSSSSNSNSSTNNNNNLTTTATISRTLGRSAGQKISRQVSGMSDFANFLADGDDDDIHASEFMQHEMMKRRTHDGAADDDDDYDDDDEGGVGKVGQFRQHLPHISRPHFGKGNKEKNNDNDDEYPPTATSRNDSMSQGMSPTSSSAGAVAGGGKRKKSGFIYCKLSLGTQTHISYLKGDKKGADAIHFNQKFVFATPIPILDRVVKIEIYRTPSPGSKGKTVAVATAHVVDLIPPPHLLPPNVPPPPVSVTKAHLPSRRVNLPLTLASRGSSYIQYAGSTLQVTGSICDVDSRRALYGYGFHEAPKMQHAESMMLSLERIQSSTALWSSGKKKKKKRSIHGFGGMDHSDESSSNGEGDNRDEGSGGGGGGYMNSMTSSLYGWTISPASSVVATSTSYVNLYGGKLVSKAWSALIQPPSLGNDDDGTGNGGDNKVGGEGSSSASPKAGEEDGPPENLVVGGVDNESDPLYAENSPLGRVRLRFISAQLDTFTEECFLLVKLGPFWGKSAPFTVPPASFSGNNGGESGSGGKNNKQVILDWWVELPIHDPTSLLYATVCHIPKRAKHLSNPQMVGKLRVKLSCVSPARPITADLPLLSDRSKGAQHVGSLVIEMHIQYKSRKGLLASYFAPSLPDDMYMAGIEDSKFQDHLDRSSRKVVLRWLENSNPAIPTTLAMGLLDTQMENFAMSRAQVNILRIRLALSSLGKFKRWLSHIESWEKPWESAATCAGAVFLATRPSIVIPLLLVWLIFSTLANRPAKAGLPLPMQHDPPGIESENTELEVSSAMDIRAKLEKLSRMALMVQNLLDSLASSLERFGSMVMWKDPIATAIFMLVLIMVSLVIYTLGLGWTLATVFLVLLRPPALRTVTPAAPASFIGKFPNRADRIM